MELLSLSTKEFNRKGSLSFRRRPRKSSNPCRALRKSDMDQFQISPANDKKVDDQDQVGPEELPPDFKNYIRNNLGATGQPVLVIQKTLHASDVNRGLQRFSIPVRQVVNHGFLTEEERSRFNRDKKLEKIDALLIEPSLSQSKIKFKKWYMEKSELYVLSSGWNDVVRNNGLKPGQTVQLWSFKKGSQLYFALVRL